VLLDLLPATGLQIKYDPSIIIIYFGFGLLMITSCLSYLPYNQIWIFNKKNTSWIGSSTNRGKISLEIEFENLIREIEKVLFKFPVS
jgi:cytochrome c biogenesis protein